MAVLFPPPMLPLFISYGFIRLCLDAFEGSAWSRSLLPNILIDWLIAEYRLY